MTAAATFAIKYCGVIANDADGTLTQPPTAAAWIDKATGQMIDDGALKYDRNTLYIATPDCAQDFKALIDGDPTAPTFASTSIVTGPPDASWNATFQHGNESPSSAPWLQVVGTTSDGKGTTVTTQVNVGILTGFFKGTVSQFDTVNQDRGFPGAARALGEVKQQIQSAIDGAANY